MLEKPVAAQLNKPSSTTMRAERGTPLPYGATPCPHGVNFSVYSQVAEAVRLCIFAPKSSRPLLEYELDPILNVTGHVWHVHIYNVPEDASYSWQVKPKGEGWGPPVLDPYAKGVLSRKSWGEGKLYHPRGVIMEEEPFDWDRVSPPSHNLKDLVIYEMHVRGFTQDSSSSVSQPGTYRGIIEKIPYLKSLGVNAIELLPVQEFNEMEYTGTNPSTGQPLLNFWGYSTVSFFFPMPRYASNPHPRAVIYEFKTMVRELHRAGIEVIVDVVFNHTAEGNELGPSLSFRGLDEETYYMLDGAGRHFNYSGCGNTFNCNNAVVREFIRDCLRYWVMEFRIDGFRFDLASILGRGLDGAPLSYSPLIDDMSCDPNLAHCKLIAEAWDAGGLYQVGNFFPHYGRWAEWNGAYRDVCRRHIKGDRGTAGAFAAKLSGSEDLYGQFRCPYHSINFITAHDGFSLNDLVSYHDKHNWENGEEGRDGANDNESWNCGAEGPSEDPHVQALRERQKRNFIVSLMVSQGVPMLHMGDEYAHSKRGNNNTWCQDNRLNWFCWDKLEGEKDFFRFVSSMITFRHAHHLLKREHFLRPEDVHWHGQNAWQADWSHENRLVAFTLVDHDKGEDLYIAFNTDYRDQYVHLPSREDGRAWCRIVDTAQKAPEDFLKVPQQVRDYLYIMTPYSSIILKALPTTNR